MSVVTLAVLAEELVEATAFEDEELNTVFVVVVGDLFPEAVGFALPILCFFLCFFSFSFPSL